MSFILSPAVLAATTCDALKVHREVSTSTRDARDIEVDVSSLSAADLEDVGAAAARAGEGKIVRAMQSILSARSGRFDDVISNFSAFHGVLQAFLKHNPIDFWIYRRGEDGKLYPYLVTDVTFSDGRDYRSKKANPTVTLHGIAYTLKHENRGRRLGADTWRKTYSPTDVVRKRVADVLAGDGLFKETPGLKAEYVAALERHRSVAAPGFGKQFRFTGGVHTWEEEDYRRHGQVLRDRKVVHDLHKDDMGPLRNHAESELHDGEAGEVPEHPLVRIFDLKAHEFLWVHSDLMTPYEYDKSLRDKLVLPETHRDLLDVLTSDLDAFTGDIIEGKSAGNIVLCKGIPGVGKTLTAEVYAELIGAPLYSIHSGTLGTDASSIQEQLQVVFARTKRWGCVLLLDEADVFVIQRGPSIEQNAIVAEFLRVLEYFDGLMFMTTNRPHDIDDAIISRCAAIIDYEAPGPGDAAAIWRVMAKQFGASLGEALLAELLQLFPKIAPRDIKMLFRLALRVARKHEEPLSIDLFRRCAMFRAIKMAPLAS